MMRFLAVFLCFLTLCGVARAQSAGGAMEGSGTGMPGGMAPAAAAGASAPGASGSASGYDQSQMFNNPYYYNPYLFGGGPQQGQGADNGKTKKTYWQYDPALRGLVPHPYLRGYGPGGDPRLTYDRSGDARFTPGGGKGDGAGGMAGVPGGMAAMPDFLPEGVKLAHGEKWAIPPDLEASLERLDGGGAALMLRAPPVSGLCGRVGPLEYKIQDNTPWFDIQVTGYRISGFDRHDCHARDQYPEAEIPLDRAALRKIEQIRVLLGSELNSYHVKLSGNVFAIEPIYTPTVRPLIRGTDASALMHEYTQGVVVALFVPAAALDEDVGQQVLDFAARKGLVPVADGGMSMPPYVHGNRAWYFSDPRGGVASQVHLGPASVGTLVRSRQVLGPEGTFRESEDVDIYASLPPRR